jgi:hypothetical protein
MALNKIPIAIIQIHSEYGVYGRNSFVFLKPPTLPPKGGTVGFSIIWAMTKK